MEDLHSLADELRETFSERGHAIEVALSADTAFRRTKRPQSTLVREMVLEGVEAATAKLGLGCIPVAGGSRDVQAIIDGTDRRLRVLKAQADPDVDSYEIIASSEAIMTITDAEPDSLFPIERWVLGYTLHDDGMLAHIFTAKVLALSDDSVPRLVLGPITELGAQATSPTPTAGFHPLDENDLEGMDDAEDEAGDTGFAGIA